MNEVVLKTPNLLEQLASVAEENGTTSEKLLNQAVSEFLDKRAREKIHRESEAFKAMHAQLYPAYQGQYVAIHNGKLVGQAESARSLYIAMRQKYGQIPILIRQVTDKVEQRLTIRRPRLSKVITRPELIATGD
ncbi:DUF5678 domain-containing protein [Anaerolineales bacterium HSG6]|nr:DUF5678 domain-containing protein [Anaerolineales bacterium HSG6]